MKGKLLLFLTLLSLFSLKAQEKEFNDYYNELFSQFGINNESGQNSFLTLLIPSGGKYEGMGTAFTGVNSDIGFFNSNPSVSSRLSLSEISFIVNNGIGTSQMDTIAFTGRNGDFGYGFQGKWFHEAAQHINDWGEPENKALYSEFVLKTNLSFNFLRGFDFSGISLGVNLNAAYRHFPSELYAHVIDKDQSSLALLGDIGLLTEFNFLKFYSSRSRNFTLGASLLNIGKEFIDPPDPLPSTFKAGLSYSPIEALSITYDFSYRFNLSDNLTSISGGQGIFHAFGFNIDIVDNFSLHGGFNFNYLTDDSINKFADPRITIGTEIDYNQGTGDYISPEKDLREADNAYVFIINYTLDFASDMDFKKFDHRFSVEVKFNLGDKKRLETREKIQEFYVKGLKEYSEGNIEEAMLIWKKCLELDEAYDPAIRMIEIAKQSLELQERINESFKVE